MLGPRRLPVRGLKAKAGRNADLLARALAQAPDDAYLHYQLGKDHDVYERFADALRALRALALRAGQRRHRHAGRHHAAGTTTAWRARSTR